MILVLKVGVLPSVVAKIVGNGYCTETSVQPATVEVREYCICVCSFREPERIVCEIWRFEVNFLILAAIQD